MNSLPCDVVLLPNEELTQKAIAASRLLAAYDSLFTLELGKYYPHMSLYMFQLNEADIPQIENILSDIAKRSRMVHASATKYRVGEGYAVGYIDPEYETTDQLRSLQNKAVEAINPVRAGMRESDIAKMQDATGVKLENLQRYGYPAIGSLFRPHITLTRLKDSKPEALDLLPVIDTFSGVFDRLGLFEMGANGTCVRQIAEFPFRPVGSV